MAEIDVLLSASLKRIAQPGDAAGVADAIRTRVDAGDTGAPASSSGFGGGAGGVAGGVAGWLPWLGLVVVAGAVGGSLGPLGLLGAQITEVTTASTAIVQDGAIGYVCVGGAESVTLPAGQRVLAVARSEEPGWLGLRDPLNAVATIWVPAPAVVLDSGEDATTLPTGGACPIVETTLARPAAPIAPPADPGSGSGSGPGAGPVDTTAPSISVGSFSPQPIWGIEAAPYCATQSLVTVTATDDVGLASVTGSSPGASVVLTGSSVSSFTFAYSASYTSGSPKIVSVTFVATDTSGNSSSAPRTLVLDSSGNCLI